MSVIFPWLVLVLSVLFCLALLSAWYSQSVQRVTPPCFLDEDNVMRCNQCKKMTYSYKDWLTASEGKYSIPYIYAPHTCACATHASRDLRNVCRCGNVINISLCINLML